MICMFFHLDMIEYDRNRTYFLRIVCEQRNREVEMKEKIYTIPVNEAFEKQDGCRFAGFIGSWKKKKLIAFWALQ